MKEPNDVQDTPRTTSRMPAAKTLQLALSGVVAAGLATVAFDADAMKPKWNGHEKCYGIAKKGMNDCGNAHHDCGGMAKADAAADEWIWVPEGTCKKIAGGSTEEK